MSSDWPRLFFFFQAEDGIRDYKVTGVQTCALPICGECRAFGSVPHQLDVDRGTAGAQRAGGAQQMVEALGAREAPDGQHRPGRPAVRSIGERGEVEPVVADVHLRGDAARRVRVALLEEPAV